MRLLFVLYVHYLLCCSLAWGALEFAPVSCVHLLFSKLTFELNCCQYLSNYFKTERCKIKKLVLYTPYIFSFEVNKKKTS